MFKSRILNQTLAATLIPLLLAIMFGFIQVSRLIVGLEEHTQSEIDITTTQIEREFQFVLKASRQLASAMAVNTEVLDAFEEYRSDYLFQSGKQLVNSGLFSHVTFTDPDGVVLARGHDEHRFNDYLAETRDFQLKEMQKPFSGLVRDESTWLLTTIMPVFRFDVLYRGTIILEKEVSDEFLQNLQQTYGLNRIRISRKAEPIELKNAGRETVVGVRPLEISCLNESPCTLSIAKDVSRETATLQAMKTQLIAFTTVIILGALVFIYFSTRFALKPLRDMHDHLKRFQAETYSFEMLIDKLRRLRKNKSELGLIATSVTGTLQQLQVSQSELKKANRESVRAREEVLKVNDELVEMHHQLEDIVAERTSELIRKTEQLKAEIEERNKAEQKYRLLVENATDAICIIQDQQITFPNPMTVAMTGYSERELSLKPFLHLVRPEEQEIVSDVLQGLKPGKEASGICSFTMVNREGAELRVQMNAVSTVWEGHPGVLCFIRDITEYKRTQEILIQSEKMLSVGGLAAGMAHEINNPLAGMMQSAQMAINRLLNDHPANDRAARESGTTMEAIRSYNEKRGISRYLNNINQSGIQAARIVDNMLSFARKSDPRQTVNTIEEIIERTLELARNDYNLKKEYDFKRIKINRVYEKNLPPVRCEESKIQQVLFNIVKNAAEAMYQTNGVNGDSQLTVRTSRIDGMAQVEIADNGPGIDESVRKRIFEPFFTTKSVDKGTGLGLSVSYFIVVEDHKGILDVRSNPGEGTTFIICLPLAD